MSRDIYLPWASSDSTFDLPEFPQEGFLPAVQFVDVSFVLHGKAGRTRSLSVPSRMSCADLKGHLAVEGVVTTCGGLEIAFEVGAAPIADDVQLELVSGMVIHLHRAAEMVSVTALTTTGSEKQTDEEVYELVLPSEIKGSVLKEKIAEATSGALWPTAVFVSDGEAMEPFAVGDEQEIVLINDQVILVQRAAPAHQPVVTQAPAPMSQPVPASGGFFSSIAARLRGPKKAPAVAGAPTRFCLREASNIKVNGSMLSSTAQAPWAAAAVFDVPEPSYFQITVQLNADAPLAEAEGFDGRWMVGVVPSAAAEVRTQKQRQQLLLVCPPSLRR